MPIEPRHPWPFKVQPVPAAPVGPYTLYDARAALAAFHERERYTQSLRERDAREQRTFTPRY